MLSPRRLPLIANGREKGLSRVQLVGLIAGALTTGCFVPQLIRSWRTRSTRDLSWMYLLALSVGIVLWLVYGVMRADVPLVLANAVTLALVISLIVVKAMSDAAARGVERG
jgi:MtN3 and saliva related transmembrane protein